MFFKGKRDRNDPCLLHSSSLITPKNTHESHLAHAWNLSYGKPKFFSSVPLQFLFQTPLETILTSQIQLLISISLSLDNHLSVSLHLSLSGICFHRFSRPFLLLSSGIPGLKEEGSGSSPINPLKADTINPSEKPRMVVGKGAGGLKSQREWYLVRVCGKMASQVSPLCSVLEFQAKWKFVPFVRTCWQMLKFKSYGQF